MIHIDFFNRFTILLQSKVKHSSRLRNSSLRWGKKFDLSVAAVDLGASRRRGPPPRRIAGAVQAARTCWREGAWGRGREPRRRKGSQSLVRVRDAARLARRSAAHHCTRAPASKPAAPPWLRAPPPLSLARRLGGERRNVR
jgi:hypothetical protein